MADQSENVTWRDGVPVSTRYDDPYYSLENGLAETAHVFLDGNDLPARLAPGFHVAELGFGTGLNLLAFWRLARRLDVPVRYTGFEAHPISAAQMAQALRVFPELAHDADWLIRAWAEGTELQANGLDARVILGDARTTLPDWDGRADAWFLDGFAPARNPELWGADLLAEVARHTRPGGTAATYTAAGHVRRGLEAAGFTVSRTAGYGRKRHMTRAVLG